MAPRETPKVTSKLQRNISITKNNVTKAKSSPVRAIKKGTTIRNVPDKNNVKMNTKVIAPKLKTNSDTKMSTPNPKEKVINLASSVTKSVKKSTWKRRPKPAHSGVPVPEKMKRLLEQRLQDID